MATALWTGGGNDGLWNTAANWSGGSGAGGKPGAGDDVLINATNQTILGVATGISINSLTVTPGFGGQIGDETNGAVTFTAVVATLKYAGTGPSARFGCSGTVAAAEFAHTTGMVYISSGTWTLLVNNSGNINVGSSAIVTTAYNLAGLFTAQYHATVFTAFYNSGTANLQRSVTTLYAKRGNVKHEDSGTNYLLCTTVHIESGATYNKRSGGTDTTVNCYPGSRFTTEGNAGGAAGTVTITTTNKWAGSRTKLTALPGVTIVPNFAYIGSSSMNDEAA